MYGVPRLCFINKCDRTGADPWKVLGQVRDKLKLHVAAVHIPIGLEENHEGVVDLVKDLPGGLEAVGQIHAHADVLTALSRKNQSHAHNRRLASLFRIVGKGF